MRMLKRIERHLHMAVFGAFFCDLAFTIDMQQRQVLRLHVCIGVCVHVCVCFCVFVCLCVYVYARVSVCVCV